MKKQKLLIVGIIITGILISVFGCSVSSIENGDIFGSIDEYCDAMNNELQQSDYSQYSIKGFEKVANENIGTTTTKLEYILYSASVSKNVEVFLLENVTTNHLEQIRYKVSLGSSEVKFMGYLLGSTMRLLYGKNSEEEMNEFYSKLQISSPTEGMNNIYEYKGNLYRARVEDNNITVYITKDNFEVAEEKYSYIGEKSSEIKNEDDMTEANNNYLNNSNGKDFFENALCGVTGISSTNTVTKDDEITYSGSNEKYTIEVITNLNNQIKSVDMTSKTDEDNTNFFMAATRMEYEGKDITQLTEYITKSLAGDYRITYIGNAKFKLTPNSLGKTLTITAEE